jgi:hypothetical protein
MLGLAIAGATVHAGALATFFSQDDFAGLARARGLMPRLAGPWRWLSHQAFWDAMRPLAGTVPWPYHAASLAAHIGASLLAFLWIRRRTGDAAAFVGAAFLVTHVALFTSTHWIAAIGDPAALALSCAALLVADRGDRARWAALPVFALALLAKESALAVPVVAALGALRRGERPDSATTLRPLRDAVRDPLVVAMAGLAVAFAAYALTSDAMGARGAADDAAYSAGLGGHVFGNLWSYVSWTVNAWLPTMHGFSDAREPSGDAWAWAALGLGTLAAFAPALRRLGFARAALAFVALLLPVLPLRHHTYHYYLTVPLLGAAWAVAVLFAAPWRTRSPRRPPGAPSAAAVVAAALAALLTWSGAVLVRRIETMPFGRTGLLAEPTMDRARIAANVHAGIADAHLPDGARLALWLPDAWARSGPPPATPEEPYTRRNLRSALLDGLAVRVLFPGIAEARVVDRFDPAWRDAWWALCRRDGTTRVVSGEELESLLHEHGEPR